jgi:hypothetical protein
MLRIMERLPFAFATMIIGLQELAAVLIMCARYVRIAADNVSNMSQRAVWSSCHSILPSSQTFHIEPPDLPGLAPVCGTYGAGESLRRRHEWPLSASGP